jgi:hypothetical protein
MTKEEKNEYNRVWRENHPDYSKKYMKEWRKSGRDWNSKRMDKIRMEKHKGTQARKDTFKRAAKKYTDKIKKILQGVNDIVGYPHYIEWKFIKGYRRYLVSDTGQIFDSFYSTLVRPDIRTDAVYIPLKTGDKYKFFMLHNIIGESFLKKRNKKGWVEHIDNNKFNNVVTNLIWIIPIEKLLNSQFYKDIKSVNFSSYHYSRKFKKKLTF